MKAKIEKISNFDQQLKLLTGRYWRVVTRRELGSALSLSAEVIRANVVKGISSGRPEWKPIHPFTKTIRQYRGYGGDAPLVQSGTLLRNIEVAVRGVPQRVDGTGAPFQVHRLTGENLEAFVGVLRNTVVTQKPGGKEKSTNYQLANVARLQEYGYVIEVTPRMRAFFKARGITLKASTTHLTVPPRPFLRPALAESEERIKQIFAASIVQILTKIQVQAGRFRRGGGA